VRIVHWPELPATVARVEIRGDVTVAVSSSLSDDDALDLACLILTGCEFDEFQRVLESGDPSGE